VDPGAWGYAWRAMLYWALALGSGTLLWPLMTHRLEKFRIDRTWYGDRQFHQGGTARMLAKGMVPFWLILAICAVVIFSNWTEDSIETVLGFAIVSLPLLGIAFTWYSVRSFRLLTETKTAGSVGFRSHLRAPRIMGIYIFGYGLAAVITGAAAIAASLLFVALLFASNDAQFSLDDLDNLTAPGFALQTIGFATYFLVFVIWAALRHVLVTLPVWRHYADTLEIVGAQSLHDIRQRDRDEHREAEGFAEALDLGAAI
jgi:uncharacterized membrane protein YjgN (DUF898 family)